MPGPQQSPGDNPLLKGGRWILVTVLSFYLVGLLVWLIYSAFGDGWRLRAVKESEFEAADRIGWCLGYRDGWAADLAIAHGERITDGAPNLTTVAPKKVATSEKDAGDAMFKSFDDVGNSFMYQPFVRIQSEYVPLIIVRHLIVLACLLPAIPLMMASWKIGEYIAKERVRKGLSVRNHWMAASATTVFASIALMATFPFLPFTLPSVIIVLILVAVLIVGLCLMRSHMYAFS